jgi:hypothetical protein
MQRTSLFDRIHRGRIARWRAGEISDRDLLREHLRWMWKLVAGLFLATFAFGALMLWIEHGHDWPAGKLVEMLLLVFGILAIVGVTLGLRLRGFVRMGAQNLFIERDRVRVEKQAEERALTPSTEGDSMPRVYGRFRRSLRHGGVVLALASAILGAGAALDHPMLLILGGLCTICSVYLLIDRRIHLELSSAGIWCRSWGPQRYPYYEFKAVYARRRTLLEGVVLVVCSPDKLERSLSFTARLSLKSGDGMPAHKGTLTVWASKFGLPPDKLLASLAADVAKAQREIVVPHVSRNEGGFAGHP